MRNLEGQTFGRLMVLELLDVAEDSHCYYSCRCSCGNFTRVREARLVTGLTKSCGCLRYTKSGNKKKGD